MDKRRFFYDCEFIEYSPELSIRPTIDLISIGIVSYAGDEFYRVSNEWSVADAQAPFMREHVLPHLPPVVDWKSRQEIANGILDFLNPSAGDIELWGYYSAYDHVCLCWLFGCMIDLPHAMPKHTKDVKQLADAMGNPALPPKPKNQHDALADARWIRDAWRFLTRADDV